MRMELGSDMQVLATNFLLGKSLGKESQGAAHVARMGHDLLSLGGPSLGLLDLGALTLSQSE